MKTKKTKRARAIILSYLLFIGITLNAQITSKQNFINAKNEIENMLSGKISLDYERAVFITENAYHNNSLKLNEFKADIDIAEFYTLNLMKKIYEISNLNPKKNILISKDSLEKNCYRSIANYAIYKFITDTTYNIIDEKIYVHFPYQYPYNDPLATFNWKNSQLTNLLKENTYVGNCNALTSLFKILSIRLNSNANLCTTQGHIYITHADANGTYFNIELASKAFPGTGSIETITHTSDEAARSGIAMRELNLKQSIGLCLLNLAKGYQHKFNLKDDSFILECAELCLKYDNLNLNAMLLKTEVLEERLVKQNLPFNKIKISIEFLNYQNYIAMLYKLGYREMPTDMKNQVIAAITKDKSYQAISKDKTYYPFLNIDKSNKRSASLSNGTFEEVDIDKPIENYFRTVFDTKTKKIIAFSSPAKLYKDYYFDPVVFAWNIDPLFTKFPDYSPYAAFANNPILFIDSDGREVGVKDPETGKTHIYVVGAEAPKGASKFVQDTYQALNYLSKNPTRSGVNIVNNLVKSEFKLEIGQTNVEYGTAFQPHFSDKGLTATSEINFNSTQGETFSDGKIQSPVTSLAHELDHANKYFNLRNLYYKNEGTSTGDGIYDGLNALFSDPNRKNPTVKAEENRAANGYEADIAKKLKQYIRTDYYNKNQNPTGTYKTDDVIKGTPAPATTGNCDEKCD